MLSFKRLTEKHILFTPNENKFYPFARKLELKVHYGNASGGLSQGQNTLSGLRMIVESYVIKRINKNSTKSILLTLWTK